MSNYRAETWFCKLTVTNIPHIGFFAKKTPFMAVSYIYPGKRKRVKKSTVLACVILYSFEANRKTQFVL